MSDADDPTGLALQMAEASSCNLMRLAPRGRPLQFDFILYRVRGSLILSNLGPGGQNGSQIASGGSFRTVLDSGGQRGSRMAPGD